MEKLEFIGEHGKFIKEFTFGIRGIESESTTDGLTVWYDPIKITLREVVENLFNYLIKTDVVYGKIFFESISEFNVIKDVKHTFGEQVSNINLVIKK